MSMDSETVNVWCSWVNDGRL